MNIILYVVAVSIFVNVVKSGKSVEEEEVKKVKRKSIHGTKVGGPYPTSEQFETLNGPLEVFRQQRIEREKLEEEKRNAKPEKKTPKDKLQSIKEKLPEVITTLGKLKNEAIGDGSFVNSALKYAGELNKALDAALKVEEKAINFEDLKRKVVALNAMTYNIGQYAKYAKDPKNAKKLQIIAYGITQEFKRTLLGKEHVAERTQHGDLWLKL